MICYNKIKASFRNCIDNALKLDKGKPKHKKLSCGIETYLKIDSYLSEKVINQRYRGLFAIFYQLNFKYPNYGLIEKYFEILENHFHCNNESVLDVYGEAEELINQIRKTNNSQKNNAYFVYITKLIHTINHDYPIIDNKIRRFFGCSEEDNFDFKTILKVKGTYSKLENDFKEQINKFRNAYNCSKLNATKIIDFCIYICS